MHYLKPNTFKKISEETTIENYNFSDLDNLGLSILVSVGGEDKLGVEKYDRILILDEGLAFVEISGKNFELRDGSVLEIPAGTELTINGFYKAKLVKNNK